jgi:hypothetical protein
MKINETFDGPYASRGEAGGRLQTDHIALPMAVEAVRQGVHQKAPDELASLERHRVALAVLAIGGLPMFRASRGLFTCRIVLTPTRAYRAMDMPVAQQVLNDVDIDALLQKMGGKAVPQRVDGDHFIYPSRQSRRPGGRHVAGSAP